MMEPILAHVVTIALRMSAACGRCAAQHAAMTARRGIALRTPKRAARTRDLTVVAHSRNSPDDFATTRVAAALAGCRTAQSRMKNAPTGGNCACKKPKTG
jgi:hypothetical protein